MASRQRATKATWFDSDRDPVDDLRLELARASTAQARDQEHAAFQQKLRRDGHRHQLRSKIIGATLATFAVHDVVALVIVLDPAGHDVWVVRAATGFAFVSFPALIATLWRLVLREEPTDIDPVTKPLDPTDA